MAGPRGRGWPCLLARRVAECGDWAVNVERWCGSLLKGIDLWQHDKMKERGKDH